MLALSASPVAVIPTPVFHLDKSGNEFIARDIGNSLPEMSGVFFGEDIANIAQQFLA